MKRTLIIVLVFVLLFVGHRIFFAPDVYVMEGESMMPTYPAGTLMLVSDDISNLKNGDVVVVDMLVIDGKKKELIKRVVGLPNESVSIRDGKILINGKETSISPITNVLDFYGTPDNFDVVNLKEDEYFVLGDNTSKSIDSRHEGVVKRQNIRFVVTKAKLP